MKEAKQIVIIGGGTSGWLSAAFLSNNLEKSIGQPVEVTLVEASDIPTIGVGEATTPSLKLTLEAAGIDEYEFMRNCEATFKHGIEFNDWLRPDHSYFHPFQAPIRTNNESFAKHWCSLSREARSSYAETAGIQSDLAYRQIAPKKYKSGNFNGAIPYAYHLDAGKLATFLKEVGKRNGVEHIIAKLVDSECDENFIFRSITLDNGHTLHPDIVIDCTGFAALLINKDKKNTFVNKNDVLFCDSAVTTRIDIEESSSIVPYTKSTAQPSGWIWDINLTRRRGIGHVYASKYTSDEEAVETLAQYIGVDSSKLAPRKLKMRIGYHKQQWRGNCIAVGLSGGFLEPLESTGIYLVEMAAWSINQLIPRYLNGCVNTPNDYNAIMSRHYENITDFIKLHYCISERRDSQFWIDNCEPSTIPETLKNKLQKWRYDPPNDYDFEYGIICFNSENYQYVLYGMEYEYSIPLSLQSANSASIVNSVLKKRLALRERAAVQTQNNADILEKINRGGELAQKYAASQNIAGNNYRVN